MTKAVDKRRARDKKIVETYQQLENGHAVAKALGVCSPTVYAALKRQGVPLVWKRGRTRASDEEIVSAYKRLGSGIAVTKELKVCDRTVYEVLAAHGIPTGGWHKQIRLVDGKKAAKAVTMYRSGVSVSAIATKLHVSGFAVRAALMRAKVYKPRVPLKWTDADKQRAFDLYASGMTLRNVSIVLSQTERQVGILFAKERPELLRPRYGFGQESKTWKGGRVVHHGYSYVLLHPDDPFAAAMRNKAGYVLEHRIVKARALGRPLLRTETVHHIDGNPLNNDLSNLQLRNGRHDKGVALCCAECGSRNIVSVPLQERESS